MLARQKIVALDDLKTILDNCRTANQSIVHCHGVFDLLHIGHIRYLQQARKMGDILIVTITPDRYVDKGPHRPAFTEDIRAEMLASLHMVDYVALNAWPTAENTLRLLRPNLYVKGSDFQDVKSDITGKLAREEKVVSEIGAQLAFTDDLVYSSSNLINCYFSSFSEKLQTFLKDFRQRYTITEILQWLDKMASLSVLVVADVVLDEYVFCEAKGKSTTDPVLTLRCLRREYFASGGLALANYAINFTKAVCLTSILGGLNGGEDTVRASLSQKVETCFVVHPGGCISMRSKFCDSASQNKFFECVSMNEAPLSKSGEQDIACSIAKYAPHHDLVIVAAFGDFAVTSALSRTLAAKVKYCAFKPWGINSLNGALSPCLAGRADYVYLADHQLHWGTDELARDPAAVMNELGLRWACSRLAIGLGDQGCLIWTNKGEFVEVPSLSDKVVDRAGAEEAFFTVTALAAQLGTPPEISGLLGNAAWALAVQGLGSSPYIDAMNMRKFIVSLLK